MSDKTRYVLCTAITPDGQAVVGITKLKGPAFLIGKVTFPGGRIEADEQPQDAAARELREEVGIDEPAGTFIKVDEVHTDGRELHFYVVVTGKARHARQLEDEPVWVLDVPFHLEQARKQPGAYASDFLDNLDRARGTTRSSDRLAA